jgi:hypothetical protein
LDKLYCQRQLGLIQTTGEKRKEKKKDNKRYFCKIFIISAIISDTKLKKIEKRKKGPAVVNKIKPLEDLLNIILFFVILEKRNVAFSVFAK